MQPVWHLRAEPVQKPIVSPRPPRILIVDDDLALRELVRFALHRAGFATTEAADGRAALTRFAAEGADLVVLDVMLPELDGVEVCRALRRTSAVPILFLSSCAEEVDRIVGLEIGGDDYMAKPFSPRELVARIRAVLRRPAFPEAALVHGRLHLDLDTLRATWDGMPVALTATELGVLRVLLSRPGKVYSREELMDRAYGTDRIVSDRTIDSHVRGLRAKFATLGAAPIETLPSFGYRLGPCT